MAQAAAARAGRAEAGAGRRLGLLTLLAIVALGLLFPLLGASMVVVVLLDVLGVRRVPALARAFGACGAG